MEELYDNDKNVKKFLYDGDYQIDITFTKWNNNTEIEELVCERKGIKNHLNLVKCILCSPINDNNSDYHLVLFSQISNQSKKLTQATNLKFSKDEKIQCILVVYGSSEEMPDSKDMNCKLYEAIVSEDKLFFTSNNQNPLIPDTNNGSIIIKK